MNNLSSLESLIVRAAGAIASGRGHGASLVILIFHRVVATKDPLLPDEPDAATFAAYVRLLTQNFLVLPLTDAIERLRAGSLPRRSVCITFDDGYANNFDVALPILSAHKASATVFVAPGFLNGGRMFNDTIIEAIRRAPAQFDLTNEGIGVLDLGNDQARVKAIGTVIAKLKHLGPQQRLDLAQQIAARCGAPLPTDLMMSDAQVKQLHRAGIQIGAHTMTHPILTRVDANTARAEISGSKAYLEELVGSPVNTFAYPNGRPMQDYDVTHASLVKQCGFDVALSTAWGAPTARSDPFQIPRIAPWDATALRYGARIVRGYRQRSFAMARQQSN